MNQFSIFPDVSESYNSADNQYSSQYFKGYNNALRQHMDYQYQANQKQLSYADKLVQRTEKQIAAQKPAVQQQYNQAWTQFDNAVAQFQENQNMIIGMMSSFGPQVDSDEVNALMEKAQLEMGLGIQTSSFLANSTTNSVGNKVTYSDNLSATMKFPNYKDPNTKQLSKEWVNKIANSYNIDSTAVSLYANKDISEGKNPASRYDDPKQLQEVNNGVIKSSNKDLSRLEPKLNDGDLPFTPAYLPNSDNVIDPSWAKAVSQRFSISLDEVVINAKMDGLSDKDPNYRYFSDQQKLEYDIKSSGLDPAWVKNISQVNRMPMDTILFNARLDKLDGLDVNLRYDNPAEFKAFQEGLKVKNSLPDAPDYDINNAIALRDLPDVPTHKHNK